MDKRRTRYGRATDRRKSARGGLLAEFGAVDLEQASATLAALDGDDLVLATAGLDGVLGDSHGRAAVGAGVEEQAETPKDRGALGGAE